MEYSDNIWFTFSWNGQLKRLIWSDGKSTVGNMLTDGLGMRTYQMEGEKSPWAIPFSGDLVCRQGATPDQKMDALGTILTTMLGHRVHFEKSHGTRNAIVLSGTCVPPKRPDGKDATLRIDIERPAPPTRQGSFTYGGNFCVAIENQCRMQVIDQMSPRYRGGIVFNSNTLVPPDIAQNPDQIQSLLKNLARQTGLKITLEPREIDVWTWING
jgi:hypothetical protein